MNDIDDAYIKEASEYRTEAEPKEAPERKFSFRKQWIRYGAIAAACLIAAVAAYGLLPGDGNGNDGRTHVLKSETESDLPTLSVEHYAAKMKEPDEKFGNPSQESDGNHGSRRGGRDAPRLLKTSPMRGRRQAGSCRSATKL